MKQRIVPFLLTFCMLITIIMPLSVANASPATVEDRSAGNVQVEKTDENEILDTVSMAEAYASDNGIEFVGMASGNNIQDNIIKSYKETLKSHPAATTHSYVINGEVKTYSIDTQYTLYDIDKNGIPELIIREDSPFKWFIYTIVNGESCQISTFYFDSLSTFEFNSLIKYGLYEYDGNGIIGHGGGEGFTRIEYLTLFSLEGSQLSGESYSDEYYHPEASELYDKLKLLTPIDDFYPITDESYLISIISSSSDTTGGEFKISANTATTCLKTGTTFEMNVGYYRNGTIDPSAQKFIAVSSNSNVLDFTTGDWNNETGRRYNVTAKQAGNCSITFTNPSDGAANKIDFTVIDGETGYTFDGVPKMTIEEGKTTNFYNFSGLVVDGFAYTPHKNSSGNVDYYGVTMTVYNTKNLYGTVTSYSEDGEIYEVSVIDKHSDYATSFVGDLEELTNSIGDLFFLLGNDKYYSGKSISTETPVSIRVPAGGYLQISNSLSSETAVFANVIGLLVEGTLRTKGLIDSSDKLLDESANIVDMVLKDNMEKLGMVLANNFVEKQVSDELKNTVQKSFKIGTWNLNNYGDFIQSFIDNLSELGLDLVDSVSKTLNEGWGVLSVTESVVKKVIPTGHLINFLYSTLGVADEALFWINFQASANFPSGIFIYAPAPGNSYLSNGVSVTPAGPKDPNVIVHAYLVVDTEDISGDRRETYSINMYRAGEKIQPETTITVRIPLSEQFDGLNKSVIKVYRQNDDGSMTNMNATIVDGYAVFMTDHLSFYSVVAESDWFNPFTDVKDNAWYAEAVQYVYENGLMAGVSSTLFSPNSTTTRGQLVTILYRAEGGPTVYETAKFDDVPAGKWYSKAVSWASENGIVSGYGNGRFGPNDGVTREQMVTILRRYAESRHIDTNKRVDLSNYTDYKTISTYAVAPMQWAVAEGLISGTSKTDLSPKGTSTRAQIAVVLKRYQEKFADSVKQPRSDG